MTYKENSAVKVQAKKTKTAVAKAAKKPVPKPAGKTKAVVKSKPVAKTKVVVKAKPVAKAKPAANAKSVAKAKVPAKTQAVTKGKVTSKAVPSKKATAKPQPKSKVAANKPTVKPVAKKPIKSTAKVTAKVVGKSAKKDSSKIADKAKQAAKSVKTLAKSAVQGVAKALAKVAGKATDKKADKAVVKSSAQPSAKVAPASAVPVQPVPVVAVPLPPGTVVQKGGRPSARLQQITVPSMAQSVASTAAKASFTKDLPPLFTPPPMVAAKKDPKLANNWKSKPADKLTDAELLAMPDSEYMNDKQMAVFRLKLVELKNGILSSASETTEHLRDDTVVVPDPADRATIEEEHALELRTRDRERKLLKKIEQSINRIDAGDYGYCDETGEVIGVGRLIARPTATLTLEAQQRRELKQKMFGD